MTLFGNVYLIQFLYTSEKRQRILDIKKNIRDAMVVCSNERIAQFFLRNNCVNNYRLSLVP